MTHPPNRPRVFAFERNDPSDDPLTWLAERGVEVVLGKAMWAKGFKRFTEEEIIAAADGFDGVIGASGANFTRRVIDALPRLKFISKFGVGVDSIDIAHATEKGVLVCNTPVENQAAPVSEHAIAMMLTLRKRLHQWTPAFMAGGGWRADIFCDVIAGSTVGIVGLGRIGGGVAKRLLGWDARILGYDPFLKEAPRGVELTSLDRLLAESDVVTLHAVPTPENRGLINADALSRMKKTAILINTGRASLVDYPALRNALAEGKIWGAGLDVFEPEPPDPKDPLFQMKNVVVSPHSATWNLAGLSQVGWFAARNMWSMISGEGEAAIVNPEARQNAKA
jgi:D-3-phosphoglycerate dehydrogenase / 2-oxoglutarate reductase